MIGSVIEWDSSPDLPVIVTEANPGEAVLVAVSVSVLVLVALPGLKEAVTPAGRPDALSAAAPVKPPDGMTVIVLAPVPPLGMLRLFGDADRLKSGSVRLMPVVRVRLPDTPVIVIGNVPTVAVALAVSVSTLVPVALAGLKDAVTPDGSPEALKETGSEKPLKAGIVIVVEVLEPGRTLKPLGEAVRL